MDKHFKEHSDIVIPTQFDNEEWKDTSWHNDATASLEQVKKTSHGNFVRVWVFDDDPDKREMQGGKFWTEVSDDLSSEPLDCEMTDSIEEALATVQRYNENW